MSRGPGRIERAIEAAFLAAPSSTFTIADLAPIAYPGLNAPEKRHRVSIIRAADKVARRLGWVGQRCERPGHSLIFYNLLDVRSYALGKMRADFVDGAEPLYRIEYFLDKPRPDDPWAEKRSKWHLIQPGGAWWRHVEIHKAERAGDAAEVERLTAELRSHARTRAAELGVPGV